MLIEMMPHENRSSGSKTNFSGSTQPGDQPRRVEANYGVVHFKNIGPRILPADEEVHTFFVGRFDIARTLSAGSSRPENRTWMRSVVAALGASFARRSADRDRVAGPSPAKARRRPPSEA